MKQKVSPVAEKVIKKCGGAMAIANWLGINRKNVYAMTYPKEKGGTGGLIPAHYQETLLKCAWESGIDLRPEELVNTPNNKSIKYNAI